MTDVAGGSGGFAAAGPERVRDRRPVPWSPVFGGTTDGHAPGLPPASSAPAASSMARGTSQDEPAAAGRGVGQDSAGVPAAGSGDDRDAPTPPAVPGTDGPGRPRRRRTLLAVLAGVVVIGGGAAAVATGVLDVGRGGAGPAPDAVVLPSPTPTVAPAPRQPVSAFADSLPSSVLAFALTSLAEHQPLLVAGAVEGYRLDYADGSGGSVTVTAAQWESDADAVAALAAANAAAAATAVPVTDGGPTSGEVQVGGAVVGTWTLTQAADGTGTVTWSNGTVVLQATGPADVVRDVYAAYPY